MRGVRALLKRSEACKLVNKRYFKSRGGRRLRGVTKFLEQNVFSAGEFPSRAISGGASRGPHWRGWGGGRRRGVAVDSQVSRLASTSETARRKARMLVLTKVVFSALAELGLAPVAGQHGVCSEVHRLGTAADIVAVNKATGQLVLVELKSGFDGEKTTPAYAGGKQCSMQKPLSKVKDSLLNRHLAQLALTHALFLKNGEALDALGKLGVGAVEGLLLYASGSSKEPRAELYWLDEWWKEKSSKMLKCV